jgi:hypothetical protein
MVMDENRKVWLVGLSVACPHGQETKECPLRDLRSRSRKERVEAIGDMTENQMKECLCFHDQCSTVKSAL